MTKLAILALTTQTRADSIRQALSSPTTCSSDTASELEKLLFPRKEDKGDKENAKPRQLKAAATLASTRVKQTNSTRTTTRTAVSAQVDGTKGLVSPKERFALATEVVNTTLKILASSLKPQPKLHQRLSTLQNEARSTPQHKRCASTPHANVKVDKTSKPLRTKANSQFLNGNNRTQRRSSSFSGGTNNGPHPHILAIAECARLAFAYLRSVEAGKSCGKDLPALQVEQGMVALIGKFLGLGLDSLALKELQILKRRLETHMSCKRDDNDDNAAPVTVASLLAFRTVAYESPALSLVISFQLQVLRIAATLRRPKAIEAMLKELDLENEHAPANIILKSATDCEKRNRAARQLEALAQSLLSICPSIASGEDEAAKDATLKPSPDAIFQLQRIAFQIRLLWWKLAGHKGNTDKELMEPFSKCLSAYMRRSETPKSHQYQLCKTQFSKLEASCQALPSMARAIPTSQSPAFPMIQRNLTSLAQSAGLFDEALSMVQTKPASKTKDNDYSANAVVNIASIGIERGLSQGWDDEIERQILQALDALGTVRGGHAADLNSLLNAVVALRRSATKVFVERKGSDPTSLPDNLELFSFKAISACIRFLAYHVKVAPESKVNTSHIPQDAIADKIAKSFIDSAIISAKFLIHHHGLLSWDDLDQCLRYCRTLLQNLEEDDASRTTERDLHKDLSYPMAKLSNICWAWALKEKNQEKPDIANIFVSMRHSIAMIWPCSQSEQAAGNLLLKCAKTGEYLRSHRRLEEALEVLNVAINCRIKAGGLSSAATLAESQPLHTIWGGEGELNSLCKDLETSLRLRVLIGAGGFHDDDALQALHRATLLECQLTLICRSCALYDRLEEAGKTTIVSIATVMLSLYTWEDYPVRRLRVLIQLMQIQSENPRLLSPTIATLIERLDSTALKVLGNDTRLASYVQHLTIAYEARKNLQQFSPDLDKLIENLERWDVMVKGSLDRAKLAESVDDFDSWINLLRTISDFYDARGHDYMRMPVLSLLTRILQLEGTQQSSQLLTIVSQLGRQSLRLGYGGKAGKIIDNGRELVEKSEVTTEAKLQWYLVHAEHLVSTGDFKQSIDVLHDAEHLIEANGTLADLAKPSTPMTIRLNLNVLLAQANYAHSLLSFDHGSPKDALQYAKRCVLLNRRIWITLENRNKRASKSTSSDGSESETSDLTSGITNLSLSANHPPTISMTHGSLAGPDFWPLVPSIFMGLSHLAKVCESQGMFDEAVYYLEQAFRVADAVKANTWILQNLSTRAALFANAGDLEKAQSFLKQAEPLLKSTGRTREAVAYHSAVASVCKGIGDLDDGVAALKTGQQLLAELSEESFVNSLEDIDHSADKTIARMAKLAVEAVPNRTIKPSCTDTKAGQRKHDPKVPAKTPRKTTKSAKIVITEEHDTSVSHDCDMLLASRAELLRQEALSMLLQENTKSSKDLLDQAEACYNGAAGRTAQQVARVKHLMVQYLSAVEADFTFNGLPESTVSFPSISRGDRRRSSASKGAKPGPLITKGGSKVTSKTKAAVKQDFISMLKQAHVFLVETQPLALKYASSTVVDQVCKLASSITVLLSAVHSLAPEVSLHPLQAAFSFGHPLNHTLQLEHASIEIDVNATDKAKLLQWPTARDDPDVNIHSASYFQRQYVDIIPENWSAVSLSLSEARDELFVTRYRSGESPFILRLPMSRHTSRDLDEETFSFDNGKAELVEIIELSDFSTRDGRNMSSKEAKSEWWEEREALDDRLGDLLINIENIWLGGFRGIFSQHMTQLDLLSRFQKSFENILNAHLPSRAGKSQQKKVNLDSRILNLFIGLGDPSAEEADFDEPLMDLVYFVVDILQFNGETNAYDEIDFDAIVVETLDTLRTYHAAAASEPSQQQHTILILDNALHCFPWESLPSLQHLSMSRLSSLASLRERLLCRVASKHETNNEPGHYCSPSGSTILNPSRDLANTQKLLSPYLDSLPESWTHITARAPSESEYETALGDSELLLYFGHGGGGQYIRQKNVKKLYVREGSAGECSKPQCATTWLMGCSSAHLTEHGVYTPSGTMAAYMAAGAPAVLGNLWDVTDKDIDKFSIQCGVLWGLWEAQGEETGKKKGRAAKKAAEGKGRGKDKAKALGKQKVNSVSLDDAVKGSRSACYLRYLNGAAPVVYGIPVYLDV